MNTLNISGLELAYDDVGAGPAVVLLHGFPFNRSLWQEQMEALRARHRVIAPDLPGHGDSSVKASPATMEEMAHSVAGLFDSLEIQRATVVGLSMGGYVALAFYRLFPLRVRALVLADTRAQGDTPEGKENRATQVEKALREGMESIADAMLPKLLAPETVAKRPDIVRRVREMIITTAPDGAAAALAGMAERRDQRPFLSRIICPTLIVVGREDALTPLADSEFMHTEIGGSRLEVVEGAAHVSNLEQPQAFNRILCQFLNDVEA